MINGIRFKKSNNKNIRFVQVYGERNSGTSFLSKIIAKNMKEPKNFLGKKKSEETPLGTNLFGYKHHFLKTEKFKNPSSSETLFIVIYRNPYTWIRAIIERPYALSKSISGRSVEELPNLKLFGHINGKDTPYEFHPETGEKVDLFDLRRLKIENFESLKNHVENVAFLNMEAFLSDPSATMAILSRNFESAFVSDLDLECDPPRTLVREYSKPERFSSDEMRVLNDSIHWEAEASIGYVKDNYYLPVSETLPFVILHGSSSVGKTYAVKKLQKDRDGIIDLEMDDCRYWDDYEPELEEDQVRRWFSDLTPQAYRELMSISASARSIEARRNIGYLLKEVRRLFPGPSVPPKDEIAVATCGALPFPSSRAQASVYTWLEDRLPIRFVHLLIEIPEETHLSRIEKRGRGHLKDEILKNYNRRQKVREQHDAVVSSYDEILGAIDALSGQP